MSPDAKLERGPAPAQAKPASRGSIDVDPLDVGGGPKRLSRYVLLDKLGHGGMGVVYAAYDQALDRKVAIKLLLNRADDTTHQRLIREAKAMARLSHPNVVQIYEIDTVDERTFVVMEFVEGLTLRRWMAAEPRPRSQILSVFLSAGRGLAAAHAKGLIHRDFKPENVMITGDQRVLVMDFGLARASGRAESLAPISALEAQTQPDIASGLTAAGAVIGTPAYMAPEQLEGRKLDARTDQFSYCIALWEALYEKRPFSADSLSELSDVVSAGKFDPPTRSKVPGWLRKVLRRGLEPDPDKRWPSMTELLGAIEQDPTRRRNLLAASLAASLALTAFVTALATRSAEIPWAHDQIRAELSTCQLAGREIEDQWNAEARERLRESFASTGLSFAPTAWSRTEAWMDQYALEWRALRTRTCLLERVAARRGPTSPPTDTAALTACLDERRADFSALLDAWAEADAQTVTLALSAAANLPPVSRCDDPIWQTQGLRAPASIEAEVDQLRAHLDRSVALRLAGKFDLALRLAQDTSERAKTLAWRPLEAEAYLALGRVHDELGDYDAAAAALGQAYLSALAGGHDLVALDATTALTLVVGDKLTQPTPGLRWAELGLMFIERLGLRGTIQEARLLYGLGLIQDREHDTSLAIASLERALDLTQTLLGPEHPEVARVLNGLGGVYWSLSDYERALDTQVRALAIVEAALGPKHPEVARSLTNEGLVLGRLGRHSEALTAQRRALDIREAALGPQHPDVAFTRNAIAATLALAGDRHEALAEHRRALDILEAELGPAHPSGAATLARMSELQLQLGQREAALASARRSLDILSAQLGPEHPDVAQARALVARCQTSD